MWLPFILNLETYLQSLPTWADVSVEVGTNGQKPKAPLAILLLRDPVTDVTFRGQRSGNCNIWIEAWATNSKTPKDGYTAIAALEDMFIEAMDGWQQQLHQTLSVAAKVEILRIVGDGEKNRPSCVSFTQVKISWKR